MNQKSILLLVFLGLTLQTTNAMACDFYFRVDNPKESYRVGDEVIVTVTLELTHRNCDVKPDETQFSGKGIEILGATQWVEISDRLYARKFKIKIAESSAATRFTALRECEKDGGKGFISFKVE